MIASSGYQDAFLYFGLGQGAVVLALAFLLRKPSTNTPIQRKSTRLPQTKVDRSPREAVRTPVFWVMYVMFVMVASGGLMAAAQIAPIAHDFQVANVPVSLFGLQMAALTLAISLDRIFDGVERVGRLLEDMRDTKVGMIQIAATPTLAENLLPPAVTAFKQTRPGVQITIHSMDNISVVNSVINEHVDFGLVLSPLAHFDAQLFELCSAELVCVVHPDNPLAARTQVTPKDLESYPLISFSRSLPLGMLVEKTFRDAGVPRRITMEVNQSSVACALDRAGAGVAIVDPFWLMENRDHGLVRLKVQPRTKVVAQVLMPKNSNLSRPTRILIAELRKVAKRAIM